MSKNDNRDRQRRHIAKMKAKGLRRIVLWVQPEVVEAHKIAAEQPQALNRIRKKVEKRIEQETWDKVAKKLEKRTEKAMLVQKRAQARRQTAGSNRPPDMVRFKVRPPGKVRSGLKETGWWYDPVAVVWHLPEEPEISPETERQLAELDKYEIEWLVEPLD